jgi:hypothetical protein
MRFATRSAVGVLAAAALAACDSGNKPGLDKAAGPSLYVTAPRMDQTFPVGADGKAEVSVLFDLRDYTVGDRRKGADGKDVPDTGQHLHLILDDGDYRAIYDASKPVPLGALAAGTHVVRAFPSAGPADSKGAKWHESRKNPGAFAWVRFHVKEKGGPLEAFDGKKPFLTYSRPKGEYKLGGPDQALEFPLLVDFYLNNVSLEPRGHRVRMTFDGGTPVVYTEWKPYAVPGDVAAGEHTVLLELIDRDDDVVEGPFNRTERKIKVTGAK